MEVKGECPEDMTAVADDTDQAQVVIIREPDTDQGQANTKYTNILYGDKDRRLQCVNMQTNNVTHIGSQLFVSQSIQYFYQIIFHLFNSFHTFLREPLLIVQN